jgi:large subunit ribosomal protein L31e
MAKADIKTLERTYTIPLRREYLKAPKWKRTNRAVSAVKNFLVKHLKSDNVNLGKTLNDNLWKHGIRNPPHKVKVSVTKDSEGVVRAELFGAKVDKPAKKTVKLDAKVTEKSIEQKKEDLKIPESKEELKTLQTDKPEPKEEKLPKVKDDLRTTESVPNKKNELY